MKNNKLNSVKKTARIAGFMYFLQIPLGIFGIIYVPKGLLVPGNIAATAHNILAHESLFRLSIVSAILAALATVFTALLLFRLFKQVNRKQAKLMVMFTLIVAPVTIFNELNNIAILILLKGPEYLTIYTPIQLHALVSLFLDLHKYGIQIAGLFWGLWLLPMGCLVYKSIFIPKIIGILLIIGFAGYMIDFVTFFLYPEFGIVISEYTFIGEVSMVLWLLIKGVKEKKLLKPELQNVNSQS